MKKILLTLIIGILLANCADKNPESKVENQENAEMVKSANRLNLEYIDVFIDNMDYAWENARNDDDQFYEDWSGNNQGRYYWLLHQGALIEAYGRIALYKNE